MPETYVPPKVYADRIMDALERIASDLDGEITRLRIHYPPEMEVMEIQARGKTWFTDGYRCIRDVWPCEFAPREHKPTIDSILDKWAAITPDVTPIYYGESSSHGRLVQLSNGTWIGRHWYDELTLGRGWTAHGTEPAAGEVAGVIVFRDREGVLAGAIMPISGLDISHLTNVTAATTSQPEPPIGEVTP